MTGKELGSRWANPTYPTHTPGMTIRQHIATQIAAAIYPGASVRNERIAQEAVAMADALLEALAAESS